MRTPWNSFPSLRDAIDVRGTPPPLFRKPTIASLAILMEQPTQHQSRTELVAIQPHGFTPPLIFLPSILGETFYAQSHRRTSRKRPTCSGGSAV
jgi:hypothetical protein